MDISIIFVNYKTKDLTINAINSVIEKTEGLEYEIFVVDNNSQDGSIEAIKQKYPNINIIKNVVNAGFGAANNLAIKQAKGKYILCLNTDILLVNNAIKTMFDFMEKEENQTVGVCGGYLIDGDGNPAVCGGKYPSIIEILWKFGLIYIFKEQFKNYSSILKSNDKKYTDKIEYISGADIFFRKSALNDAGIFDEQFFMYCEEVDLCKRIQEKGYKIKFVDDAKIIHFEGKSNNNSLERKKRSLNGIFTYFSKHNKKNVLLIKFLFILLYFINFIASFNSYYYELIKCVFQFEWKGIKNEQ